MFLIKNRFDLFLRKIRLSLSLKKEVVTLSRGWSKIYDKCLV